MCGCSGCSEDKHELAKFKSKKKKEKEKERSRTRITRALTGTGSTCANSR